MFNSAPDDVAHGSGRKEQQAKRQLAEIIGRVMSLDQRMLAVQQKRPREDKETVNNLVSEFMATLEQSRNVRSGRIRF